MEVIILIGVTGLEGIDVVFSNTGYPVVFSDTGWEKAMKEVLALKQQLDVATKKHAAVEDRVGHLHGALKKCVSDNLKKLEKSKTGKSMNLLPINGMNWNFLSLRVRFYTSRLNLKPFIQSLRLLRKRIQLSYDSPMKHTPFNFAAVPLSDMKRLDLHVPSPVVTKQTRIPFPASRI
ncbi:hypothetical protein CCACVL1_07087 [Corchorus capsularis]|uniref:Uncharacterized protein n=1 Tax=Corchorus capsularis TaxID=210143 RepID=A0A1R3J9L1_COCAP|nr:hypothetical protein CCACVL1_07087 [Corchorus capsularis]